MDDDCHQGYCEDEECHCLKNYAYKEDCSLYGCRLFIPISTVGVFFKAPFSKPYFYICNKQQPKQNVNIIYSVPQLITFGNIREFTFSGFYHFFKTSLETSDT